MILHLSNDLMLIGKISAWAKSNGIAYQNAHSFEPQSDWFTEIRIEPPTKPDPPIPYVFVDLQLKGLDIAALAKELKKQWPQARVVGYAQHVMTDLIATAQASEYDHVLTRGQFDRQFDQFVQRSAGA